MRDIGTALSHDLDRITIAEIVGNVPQRMIIVRSKWRLRKSAGESWCMPLIIRYSYHLHHNPMSDYSSSCVDIGWKPHASGS